MQFLINLAQSVVRINPGQGQNNQLSKGSLVSVKSIEKAQRNKSRNIVTGGKSRLYDSKETGYLIATFSLNRDLHSYIRLLNWTKVVAVTVIRKSFSAGLHI